MTSQPSRSLIPGSWPTDADEPSIQLPEPRPPPGYQPPSSASGHVITSPIFSQPGQRKPQQNATGASQNSDQPFPELGMFGSLFSRFLNAVSGPSTSPTPVATGGAPHPLITTKALGNNTSAITGRDRFSNNHHDYSAQVSATAPFAAGPVHPANMNFNAIQNRPAATPQVANLGMPHLPQQRQTSGISRGQIASSVQNSASNLISPPNPPRTTPVNMGVPAGPQQSQFAPQPLPPHPTQSNSNSPAHLPHGPLSNISPVVQVPQPEPPPPTPTSMFHIGPNPGRDPQPEPPSQSCGPSSSVSPPNPLTSRSFNFAAGPSQMKPEDLQPPAPSSAPSQGRRGNGNALSNNQRLLMRNNLAQANNPPPAVVISDASAGMAPTSNVVMPTPQVNAQPRNNLPLQQSSSGPTQGQIYSGPGSIQSLLVSSPSAPPNPGQSTSAVQGPLPPVIMPPIGGINATPQRTSISNSSIPSHGPSQLPPDPARPPNPPPPVSVLTSIPPAPLPPVVSSTAIPPQHSQQQSQLPTPQPLPEPQLPAVMPPAGSFLPQTPHTQTISRQGETPMPPVPLPMPQISNLSPSQSSQPPLVTDLPSQNQVPPMQPRPSIPPQLQPQNQQMQGRASQVNGPIPQPPPVPVGLPPIPQPQVTPTQTSIGQYGQQSTPPLPSVNTSMPEPPPAPAGFPPIPQPQIAPTQMSTGQNGRQSMPPLPSAPPSIPGPQQVPSQPAVPPPQPSQFPPQPQSAQQQRQLQPPLIQPPQPQAPQPQIPQPQVPQPQMPSQESQQRALQPPYMPAVPLPMPQAPQAQTQIPQPQPPSQQAPPVPPPQQQPISFPQPQPPADPQNNRSLNPPANQPQSRIPAPPAPPAAHAGGSQNPIPMPVPPNSTPQPAQTQAQIPPNPYVEAAVRYKLGDPLLRGYDIPPYPAPPGTAIGPNREPLYYQTGLMNIANKFHEWTQIFEGPANRAITLQNFSTIQNCLRMFAPIERGIIGAIEQEELSLEAIYLTPTHRRLLAEHIIALDIYVSVFLPFYPGLDMNAGKILATITDELYRDRKLM